MSARLGEWGYDYEAERPEAMAWTGVPTPVEEMPGMASAVQMDALRRVQGRQVDFLFLAMMSEHHRGGADMAATAVRVVKHADVRALAEAAARKLYQCATRRNWSRSGSTTGGPQAPLGSVTS